MGVIHNSKRLHSIGKIYISLPGQCWKTVLRLVTLALWAAPVICQTKYCSTMEPSWLLFYHVVLLFLAIRNKPLSCPMSMQAQNREEQYNMHHMPSLRASRWSCGRRNLAWIMDDNAILLECASKPLLEVDSIRCALNRLRLYVDSCERYQCTSNPVHGAQCEHGLTYIPTLYFKMFIFYEKSLCNVGFHMNQTYNRL